MSTSAKIDQSAADPSGAAPSKRNNFLNGQFFLHQTVVKLDSKFCNPYQPSLKGSHHRQVPDDKLDCLGLLWKKLLSDKAAKLFIRDPVLPPRVDGSPLRATFLNGPLFATFSSFSSFL